MKNKKILIILASVIVIVIVVVLTTTLLPKRNGKGDDSYQKNISILSNEKPSIYLLGDDVSFRNGVNYQKITAIDTSISSGFLVINDRNGNVVLTEENYTYLLNQTNSNLTLIYLGDDLIDEFVAHDFLENISESGIKGFKRAKRNNVTIGFWTNTEEEVMKTNNELLGQIIVGEIIDEIKK